LKIEAIFLMNLKDEKKLEVNNYNMVDFKIMTKEAKVSELEVMKALILEVKIWKFDNLKKDLKFLIVKVKILIAGVNKLDMIDSKIITVETKVTKLEVTKVLILEVKIWKFDSLRNDLKSLIDKFTILKAGVNSLYQRNFLKPEEVMNIPMIVCQKRVSEMK